MTCSTSSSGSSGRLGVAVQGASIVVDVPPTLRVVADPDRLAQVLRNLLTNALAHTPPAGVITVAAAPADGEESMVEVRVTDTGPGIAAADLPHVFERFFRGDRSRSRATGGAGLGLAITRRLVEAHGGRITAESPPGGGATIRFTVPAPAVASRDEADAWPGRQSHAHRRSG